MIKPYLDRTIERHERVKVYRNLNGGKDKIWSIKQRGLVVAHADSLAIHNASFEVSQSTAKLVRERKRKTPHAFITGYGYSLLDDAPTEWPEPTDFVTYNPYEVCPVLGDSRFLASTIKAPDDFQRHIYWASYARCHSDGKITASRLITFE